MKNLLSTIGNFYNQNGLLGICASSVGRLRGGDDSINIKAYQVKESSSSFTSSSRSRIEDILDNDQISEECKKPFRRLREGPMFSDGEKLQMERLRKSLVAKTKHPVYSKIKAKVPYALLTPFTFNELSRLATYRLAGFTSAPLTIGGFIGFSMSCAVTFSMLEMYAPDKFKFPCKCAKWAGGVVYFGVCSSVDYLTGSFEDKIFGQELPLDAPQFMGTFPTKSYLNELRKLKDLAESIIEKSPTLGTD